MFNTLKEDLHTVFARDPAARNSFKQAHRAVEEEILSLQVSCTLKSAGNIGAYTGICLKKSHCSNEWWG